MGDNTSLVIRIKETAFIVKIRAVVLNPGFIDLITVQIASSQRARAVVLCDQCITVIEKAGGIAGDSTCLSGYTTIENWLRTDAISFHLCFSWQEKETANNTAI